MGCDAHFTVGVGARVSCPLPLYEMIILADSQSYSLRPLTRALPVTHRVSQ